MLTRCFLESLQKVVKKKEETNGKGDVPPSGLMKHPQRELGREERISAFMIHGFPPPLSPPCGWDSCIDRGFPEDKPFSDCVFEGLSPFSKPGELEDVLLPSDKSPSHSFSLVFDINSGKLQEDNPRPVGVANEKFDLEDDKVFLFEDCMFTSMPDKDTSDGGVSWSSGSFQEPISDPVVLVSSPGSSNFLSPDCLVISHHLRSKGARCKNPLISVVYRGTWRILPASPPFIQTPSKMPDSDVNNLTGAAKHSGSHDTAMSSASWHFGDLAQGSDFSFPMKTESRIASQERGGN
ncbi:unnamed protein product [Sphagnum balticum]